MHERRFSDKIQRLRSPERLALLETDKVTQLTLEGIDAENILDVGTGTGIFAESFAKYGLKVSGIDPSSEMLDEAKKYLTDADLQTGVIENIPYPDESFDIVFLGHVLHESDDVLTALNESKRVSRKRIAILEWPYKDEDIGPPLAHRLKPDAITELINKTVFGKTQTIELSHMVLYILDK